MFHAEIGRHIGLDIQAGRSEQTIGIQGAAKAYMHEIALFVPGGPIHIEAGFMENLAVSGLLGMNGFFEHFIVKFDSSELTLEIDRIHQVQ
jgi:hypothetical protein